MFRDKPDRLTGRHPIQSIEPREINRARIAAKGALKSQIEINVEVAHRQFAQRSIDRFAIAAAGEVRFGDRAPMSANFENRDHMIGVLLGLEIENERRKTENSQSGRRKNSSFETGSGAILQNFFRRARSVTEIVRQFVQESLDSGGCFQRAKFA